METNQSPAVAADDEERLVAGDHPIRAAGSDDSLTGPPRRRSRQHRAVVICPSGSARTASGS
jgi:hypothetical protein